MTFRWSWKDIVWVKFQGHEKPVDALKNQEFSQEGLENKTVNLKQDYTWGTRVLIQSSFIQSLYKTHFNSVDSNMANIKFIWPQLVVKVHSRSHFDFLDFQVLIISASLIVSIILASLALSKTSILNHQIGFQNTLTELFRVCLY